MLKLFKYAFIVFSVFAIYSAPPEHKMAMYDGLIAYAQSMKEACLRRDGPCHHAEAVWQSATRELQGIKVSSAPKTDDT